MRARLLPSVIAILLIAAAGVSTRPILYAGHALLGRLHADFILSLLASSFFTVFFLLGALALLLKVWQSGTLGLGDAISIRRQDLVMGVFLLAASTLVITRQTATSFVSWEEERGAPLAWVQSGRYYGPCYDEPRVCTNYWLQSVRPGLLIVDFAAMCIAAGQVRRLPRPKPSPAQR